MYFEPVKKFRVTYTFLSFLAVIIALGYWEQFFLILTFVSLHELSHILTAKLIFTIKRIPWRLEHVTVTSIGMIASIRGLDGLSAILRTAVFLAGPLCNGIIALIAYKISAGNHVFWQNTALLIFNLLPAFPLDGGRLLQVVLTNTKGILLGNKTVYDIGIALSYAVIFVGIIQVILFPYNVSLLCAGYHMKRSAKKEHALILARGCSYILSRKYPAKTKKRPLRVYSTTPITYVFSRLCHDYLTDIFVCDANVHISEQSFITAINEMGLSGRVGEVIKTSSRYENPFA